MNVRFDVVGRTSVSYKLFSLVQIHFPNSFQLIKNFLRYIIIFFIIIMNK